MQGIQIKAYVGMGQGENQESCKATSSTILSSWAPSYEQAIDEKRRIEEEHGGYVELQR